MSDTVSARALAAQMRDQMAQRGIHQDAPSGLAYFSGYGADLYSCEIYFDAMALLHMGGEGYVGNALRLFLAEPRSDGFLPRHWHAHGTQGDQWSEFEAEEHAQPFLCQIALLLSRVAGGMPWPSRAEFATLRAYLEHWLAKWDRDGDGLCEWASAPHAMADTQLDRVGVWRSHFCEGVDLNCYLYMDYRAAAALARALGLQADAGACDARARVLADRIRATFWDEADGFFYDRDIRTGKPIRIRAVEGFMPLWARLATPEQARRLVREHLTNPDEFWTPFPPPSYARCEPNYTQYHRPPPGSDPLYYLSAGHGNWRGSLWPHMVYMLGQGLAAYGYMDEALHMAELYRSASAADLSPYEYYDAETGQGLGAHPFWAGAEVLGALTHTDLLTGFDPTAVAEADQPLDDVPVRAALGLTDRFPADVGC